MSAGRKPGGFPVGWITAIIFMVLLFVTNPTEQQFTSFLKDKIREQAEGDQTLAGDLKALFSGSVASLTGMASVRSDFYLCSTCRLKVAGEEYLYLDVLDHFFKLK